MERTSLGLLTLVFGLLCGCGSNTGEPPLDATSDLAEPDTPFLDTLDSIIGPSDADGSDDSLGDTTNSAGWIGAPTFVTGGFPPPAEEAIANTEAGWVILISLGPEDLTVTQEGHATTLQPGTPDRNRFALLPIGIDGAPGTPIEIASSARYLGYGSLSRCGDHLWGAATTNDGAESWVFRAGTDLSNLTVAQFVATGTALNGDQGVAQIYRVECASAEADFVVRVTAGMQIFPPTSTSMEFPHVQGETWLLVDAVSLFNAGAFEYVGEANVAIGNVVRGRQHTAIYAAYDVNGDVPAARTRILRHDFLSGATERFIDVDLPSNVFNPIYAENVATDDRAEPAVMCARYQGEAELDGFTISDPLASDFCAVVRDGRVTAVRTFQNIVPTGVALARGLGP